VPPDSPRIAELRRRVHADPASIAFAQLAEEYRRAGQYDEAVKYCRNGLARHPGYLSARVTLGRALSELGVLDEAATEFAVVLKTAPDNLAAIRGLAEIRQRQGDLAAALDFYQRALALARFDPDLEETVDRIGREMGDVNGPTSFDDLFPLANALAAPAAAGSLDIPGAGAAAEPGTSDAPDTSGAADAPQRADPAGPRPPTDLIDFDAILASLGVPDASPPPIMEMLLAGPSPTAPATEPSRTLPPTSRQDDPTHLVLTELESWLQVLHNEERASS
jgi:tetratricopeptide (TPR) repeat protein